jgi:ketosteroid isomerase-like protein
MTTSPAAALAVVERFIDCINRGDVDGLGALMTDDHQLCVFDEAPLEGRAANIEAWRGYARAFPRYVIYPHSLAEKAGVVAVLGHTTGSHLGLPDVEEQRLTLIWIAEVCDGQLRAWRLVPDTAETRTNYGLTPISPRMSAYG